jgi:hypothetical protein
LLVALLLGCVGLSFPFFGSRVYPVPTGDSQAFLPPAILFAQGGGLRNPTAALTRSLDPTGQARYLQYPPLFQLVLARLMPRPEPSAAFLVLGLLSAANLLLAALLFGRIAAGAPSPRWASSLAVATAGMGLTTVLLGQQTGRPEGLATFWLLLTAHTLALGRPRFVWPLCGLLLGLMGATHPMGGVLLGLLLTLIYAALLPPRVAVACLASILGTSLSVFSAVLAAGPFGIRATLEGIRHHAGLTLIGRHSTAGLTPYWLTNPGGTLYALPYLLLVAMAVPFLLARRHEIRSPWLFTAALALLAVVAWTIGVRSPELSYNLLLLAPLVLAANLWLALRSPRRRPLLLGATAIVQGATAIGYLRALVLFFYFLRQGAHLDAARRDFQRLLAATQGPISVTSSLWVLSEDYERLRTLPAEEPDAATGGILVLQQTYSGLLAPQEIAGFRLVEDRFVRHPCKLLGVTLARTVPGYSFAVYVRTEKDPR